MLVKLPEIHEIGLLGNWNDMTFGSVSLKLTRSYGCNCCGILLRFSAFGIAQS